MSLGCSHLTAGYCDICQASVTDSHFQRGGWSGSNPKEELEAVKKERDSLDRQLDEMGYAWDATVKELSCQRDALKARCEKLETAVVALRMCFAWDRTEYQSNSALVAEAYSALDKLDNAEK